MRRPDAYGRNVTVLRLGCTGIESALFFLHADKADGENLQDASASFSCMLVRSSSSLLSEPPALVRSLKDEHERGGMVYVSVDG